MNGNQRYSDIGSHYQNYNEILQDSVFYEDDDDMMRGNYIPDDMLGAQEEQEDDLENDDMIDDSTGQVPDSDLKTKRNSIEEFFRCTICYEKANKPLMCPQCSKICCSECFKQWLNEHSSTCPCCRSNLKQKTLAKVNFLSQLNEEISKYMKSGSEKQGSGMCDQHNSEIKYFCKQCSEPICSDCAVLSKEHKGHEFEHLKTIYESKLNKLKSKIGEAQTKVTQMHDSVAEIESMIKKLEEIKQEKRTRIMNFQKKMKDKIDKEYREKTAELSKQRDMILAEYKDFKKKVDGVNKTILESNNVEIVQTAGTIEKRITELTSKAVPLFKPDPSVYKYSSDKLFTSTYHSFVMKPFSSYSKNEIVYSEPVVINGISWRLKVYPDGNGNGNPMIKGNYLSVFVEMHKGWPGVEGSYEYRIELVNRVDRSKRQPREHVSEFETNTSWGYNKFIKLDQLVKEGYLDLAEDVVEFYFYVFPANECQLISDLNRNIESLEAAKAEQAELIKQLTEGQQQNESASVDSEDKSEADRKHRETNLDLYRSSSKPEGAPEARAKVDEISENTIFVSLLEEKSDSSKRLPRD